MADTPDRITEDMIACWRVNYGLDKMTPADAMRWWEKSFNGSAPAGAVAALGLCLAEIDALRAELEECRLDAMRGKWHKEHLDWRVCWRVRPGKSKEWRLRDDEGHWWGSWWPTYEQTIDAAIKQMALSAAIAAQEQK